MATRDELAAVAARHASGTRTERARILDEFTAVTGHHRKHATRLLRAVLTSHPHGPRPERRIYDEAVRQVENSVQNFPDSGGKQHPIVSTLVHAIIRLFCRSIWGVAHGLDCRDPAPSFGEQGEHQFDRA